MGLRQCLISGSERDYVNNGCHEGYLINFAVNVVKDDFV